MKKSRFYTKGWLQAIKTIKPLNLSSDVDEYKTPLEFKMGGQGSDGGGGGKKKKKGNEPNPNAKSKLEEDKEFMNKYEMNDFSLVGEAPKIEISCEQFIYYKRKIHSIMKDNMYDREIQNMRRGKLDFNRLWKIRANSDRVFKKKVEPKNKNYNLSFVLDASGSMSGDRAYGLLRSVEIIDSIFGEIETIDCYYSAFTDLFFWLSVPFLQRDINEILSRYVALLHDDAYDSESSEEVSKQYKVQMFKKNALRSDGGNNDAMAIEENIKMMKGLKNKSFIFVLCDGGINSSDYRKIEKQIKEAKKYGITIIGVGIGTEEVSKIYEDYIVVERDASDLPEKLFQVFNKIIKRG